MTNELIDIAHQLERAIRASERAPIVAAIRLVQSELNRPGAYLHDMGADAREGAQEAITTILEEIGEPIE